MTVQEKRNTLASICDNHGICDECPFNNMEDAWCEDYNTETVPEELLDKALEYVETSSAVNHPSHYNQGGIECIDCIEAAFGKEATAHFCIGNVMKYIFRHCHKNGVEDIEKAEWYLRKYKELQYGMDEN